MGAKKEDQLPEEVVVETPEAAEDAEPKGDVEVDVDPKDEAAKKPVEDKEPKYVPAEEFEKVRKQLNGLSYLGRKFEEVSRKIDALQASSNPVRSAKPESEEDELDDLVKKDWKLAVKKVSRDEAAEILREQREEQRLEQARAAKVQILEQNKQAVRSKYPDLDDPESELAQRYLKVLQSDPAIISSEYGPVIAMHRMEEEMRQEGIIPDEPTKRKVTEEVERRVRATATSIPKGTPQPSNNKVTLTREEQEICRHNGIRFEDYARMKKARNSTGKEGVTV